MGGSVFLGLPRKTLAQRFTDSVLWNSPASIGITVSHLDSLTPETLVKHADSAMYLAKKEGGDRLKLYSNIH